MRNRLRARRPSVGLDLPRVRRLVVGRGRDAAVELDVPAQVQLVGHEVAVAQGLRLGGEVLAPLPLAQDLLGEGVAVGPALGVEAGPGVPVPVPGAADVAAGLEDPGAEPELAQAMQLVHAGEPGADDDDVERVVCVAGHVANDRRGSATPSRRVLGVIVYLRPKGVRRDYGVSWSFAAVRALVAPCWYFRVCVEGRYRSVTSSVLSLDAFVLSGLCVVWVVLQPHVYCGVLYVFAPRPVALAALGGVDRAGRISGPRRCLLEACEYWAYAELTWIPRPTRRKVFLGVCMM